MRRWWWTLVGGLVCGAAPALVATGGELPGERVVVRLGPDRQVEVVTQAMLETSGGDRLPPRLIHAVPADQLQASWLPDLTAWPDPEPRTVIRRPWMLTNTSLFLDILRAPAPPEEPTAPATAVAPPAAAPAALSLAALLEDDAQQPEPVKMTAEERSWAEAQAAAGRRFVIVPMLTSAEGYESPALRLRFRAAPPLVPFSTALAAGSAGFSIQSRYQLTIVADGRMQPTYADGYPPFPELALRCAEPNPAWVDAPGGAKYATHYDANVPVTARSEDLLLQPVTGEPVPPPAPRTIDYPRPIPIDVIVASALLAALIQFIRYRRRRAGTTSSAT